MFHVPQTCVNLLEAEVDKCDAMLLDEDRRNDTERILNYLDDQVRLRHYSARREALCLHRRALVSIYVQITGKDQWADIPF
jgi:hypothetical protein